MNAVRAIVRRRISDVPLGRRNVSKSGRLGGEEGVDGRAADGAAPEVATVGSSAPGLQPMDHDIDTATPSAACQIDNPGGRC